MFGTVPTLPGIFGYRFLAVAMLGISVPSFVLGPLLIIFFSLTLYIMPPARWGDLRHLILPALTLGGVLGGWLSSR